MSTGNASPSQGTKVKSLEDSHGTEIVYLGPGPEAGPLPAFFYFALSGEESLSLPPYCQPAAELENLPLRTFSLTLPGHGPGFNKFHAMQYWADQMAAKHTPLETFFEQVTAAIDWLVENGLVDPEHIAVGGLSRGAFIATHIAARDPRIHTLLGYAPLTRLDRVSEFASEEQPPHVKLYAEMLNLEHVVDQLDSVRDLRFYIGNLDTRVDTEACFHLIQKLANHKVRQHNVELYITQSFGHKGHGTTSNIFKEGALWVKEHLIGS